MATLTERFGERVRKFREKRRLSQLDLAQKAKLDLTTINEIENGNREPMLKTIWKIANALEIKLSELTDVNSGRYNQNDFGTLAISEKKTSYRKQKK